MTTSRTCPIVGCWAAANRSGEPASLRLPKFESIFHLRIGLRRWNPSADKALPVVGQDAQHKTAPAPRSMRRWKISLTIQSITPNRGERNWTICDPTEGKHLQPTDRDAHGLVIADKEAERHEFTEHRGSARQPIEVRCVKPGRKDVGDSSSSSPSTRTRAWAFAEGGARRGSR
jgi:hypothetical protein